MAQFTRRLSELINSGFDLGLTPLDYPIFDEAYREKLNKKIQKHYWNYEIGHETEDMFRFALNRKMNEIMPYYNQLYTSTQLTFDPLKTISYTDIANTTDHLESSTTDHLEGTRSENTDNTATANSKARNVNSETPQVKLSPDEDYASSAVDTIAQNDSSTNSTVDGSNTNDANGTANRDATGTVNRSVQGYQGLSASELLQRFRSTFLNIDMNVIKDLEELFMMVWHNGDEYSEGVGISYGIPFGYFPIF